MQRDQRRFYHGDENAGVFSFFLSFFFIHHSGTDQSGAAGVTCKHTDRARVCVKLPL